MSSHIYNSQLLPPSSIAAGVAAVLAVWLLYKRRSQPLNILPEPVCAIHAVHLTNAHRKFHLSLPLSHTRCGDMTCTYGPWMSERRIDNGSTSLVRQSDLRPLWVYVLLHHV
jgi:hypothetical protein